MSDVSPLRAAQPTVEITVQRKLAVKRGRGTVNWQVVEFDHGRAYMLIAEAPGGTQFSAHFDAEQWAAFQSLIGEGAALPVFGAGGDPEVAA